MRPLVNLLVVVLMLAVVVGLGFPFIVRLRDAADRTRCGNHVNEIVTALHMYHNDYKRLPYARLDDDQMPIDLPPTGLHPEKRLSWQYDLWRYVESLMDVGWHEGLKKAWDAEDNDMTRRVFIPWCLCPRNPHARMNDTFGLTHYVGIAGIGADAANLPASDPQAGVFGYRRAISLKDIKDGQATTMMVAETGFNNGPWAAAGPATLRGLDPARPPYLGADGQFSSRHRYGRFFSRWPYATNVGFADRSVRSFSPSTDPRVFEAMATIAGGEQVSVVGDP